MPPDNIRASRSSGPHTCIVAPEFRSYWLIQASIPNMKYNVFPALVSGRDMSSIRVKISQKHVHIGSKIT